MLRCSMAAEVRFHRVDPGLSVLVGISVEDKMLRHRKEQRNVGKMTDFIDSVRKEAGTQRGGGSRESIRSDTLDDYKSMWSHG